ncbi:MAG: hypothetical protein ACF8QF_05470 [Phycisphaerales bacterium]
MPNRTRRVLATSLALTGALVLTGCSGYWQVTDTRHGDVYYTDQKPSPRAETGLVRFVDADTGAVITLDAYAIERADKKQARESVLASHPEG